MKTGTFSCGDVSFRCWVAFYSQSFEPHEVRRFSSTCIVAMLIFVINDTGTMFTASKHWVRPLLYTELLYCFIVDMEKFVGTGNDADIHISDIGKPSHRTSVSQSADNLPGVSTQQSGGPFVMYRFAFNWLSFFEDGFWTLIDEITPFYRVDPYPFGWIVKRKFFFRK